MQEHSNLMLPHRVGAQTITGNIAKELNMHIYLLPLAKLASMNVRN